MSFFALNLQLIQFWSDVFTFQKAKVNPATDFVGFSVCSGLGTDLRLCHFSLTVIKNYMQKKSLGITPLVKIFKTKRHYVQHWRSVHTPYMFIPVTMQKIPKRKVRFLFYKFFFFRVILEYMSSDAIQTSCMNPSNQWKNSTLNWEKIHIVES